MGDSEEALVARLQENASYFEKMLEFIPVEVYFPTESEDAGNRFVKNRGNKAPNLAIKQASKKARKAKLNPANFKTVPDVQREVLEERQALEASQNDPRWQAGGGVKRKRMDSDSELSPEPEPQNPLELLGLAEPPARAPATKPTRADLKELRDRLQQRIAELRAKRGAKDPSDKTPKPPKKKRKTEKKKKKKQNKQKKGATPATEANPQEGANSDNAKPSNKRKRSDSVTSSDPSQANGPAEEKSSEKETKQKKVKKQKKEKADIRYGALNFGNGAPLPESLAMKHKGLSKKKLLQKLEKEQERDTKNGDTAALEKKAWDKLMSKAKGEKVKDNIVLVKKSLKKEEKRKKKSKMEWEQREKDVRKKQEFKQKKRNANIAEYLAKKKERRIAKRTGKKLKRPGFEGKKKRFLNK